MRGLPGMQCSADMAIQASPLRRAASMSAHALLACIVLAGSALLMRLDHGLQSLERLEARNADILAVAQSGPELHARAMATTILAQHGLRTRQIRTSPDPEFAPMVQARAKVAHQQSIGLLSLGNLARAHSTEAEPAPIQLASAETLAPKIVEGAKRLDIGPLADLSIPAFVTRTSFGDGVSLLGGLNFARTPNGTTFENKDVGE